MNCTRLKYRQFFTIFLLGAYLVGHLSMPIFEGVHFLLHLGDKTPIHSFQTHSTQHNHQVLTILEELSNNSSTDVPIEQLADNKYKKLTQQLANNSFVLAIKSINTTANFAIIVVPPKTPFLPLYAPPPEVQPSLFNSSILLLKSKTTAQSVFR